MLILVFSIITWGIVRGVRRRRRETRDQRMFDAFTETVDLLLASLRAGYSLQQATSMLADVVPMAVRSEFEALRSRVEEGSTVIAALANTRAELDPVFRSLIDLIITSLRLGIPVETFIVQIQSESRHIRRNRSELRARQLAVRLTLPLVCCSLPSFSFLIIVPMVAGTIAHLRSNGTPP